MAVVERSLSCQGNGNNSAEYAYEYNEKHVRIADQNLTLTYNPKSFSMPDLLQMDTLQQSFHKHPNTQLSTRVTNTDINIKNFLPKSKTPNMKRRFASGLKQIMTKPAVLKAESPRPHRRKMKPRSPPSTVEHISKHSPPDKINKKSLLHPFRNLHLFTRRKRYNVQAIEANLPYRKSRSASNLNSTNNDEETFQESNLHKQSKRTRHKRPRSLSDSDITVEIPQDYIANNGITYFGRSIMYQLNNGNSRNMNNSNSRTSERENLIPTIKVTDEVFNKK